MTVDFERQRRRSRFEAWALDHAAGIDDQHHGPRKREVIGAMSGTVVEVGPGPGVNMRYYADDVRVIAIEPNPLMHERLRGHAREHDVDLEIRTLRGEHLDLDDASADAVVSTLVLCGVDDPRRVVSEIARVLKPGGTYFFLEHVAAPPGTWTRRVQALVKRPHRWMFNGCEVDRETAPLLRDAGFAEVEIEEIDAGLGGAYVRHQIVGVARR